MAALRIVLETDLLESVQQSWQPTTALVCADWLRAHKEKGIDTKALPDDVYELRDALKEGMPLRCDAIAHVCREDRLRSLDYKGFCQYFSDLDELVRVHADITTPRGAALFEEFYKFEMDYTDENKYVVNDSVFDALHNAADRQIMLEHGVHVIARAVARANRFGILRGYLETFLYVTCNDESHSDDEKFDVCTCNNDIRKIFACAIFDMSDCDRMLGWADNVLLGA